MIYKNVFPNVQKRFAWTNLEMSRIVVGLKSTVSISGWWVKKSNLLETVFFSLINSFPPDCKTVCCNFLTQILGFVFQYLRSEDDYYEQAKHG